MMKRDKPKRIIRCGKPTVCPECGNRKFFIIVSILLLFISCEWDDDTIRKIVIKIGIFHKLISLLIPIPLILNIQPVSSSVSPERKMIADAIKIKASITPEDSTKIRLKKQENFLKIIDQIFLDT